MTDSTPPILSPEAILSPEEIDFYLSENVTHVLHVNQQYAETDDDPLANAPDFPVGVLWILVLVLSGVITITLFYFSYWCHKKRQERLAAEHHQNFGSDGDCKEKECASEDEIEMGLAVKEWMPAAQGSGGSVLTTATVSSQVENEESMDEELAPPKSDDGASSVSSNGESSPIFIEAQNNHQLQRLMSQPRCVLCSCAFQEGDRVSVSKDPACAHEYHLLCISKWLATKNKNCPVCKRTYIVAESV